MPSRTSFVYAWLTPFNESHLFEEDALEGAPEVLVEDGVDDGVEGRVGVAQPEGEGEAGSLNLPAKLKVTCESIYFSPLPKCLHSQKPRWHGSMSQVLMDQLNVLKKNTIMHSFPYDWSISPSPEEMSHCSCRPRREEGRKGPPSREARNMNTMEVGPFPIHPRPGQKKYRVAHLLRERDMLTPNFKLRSVVNLSCDLGRWRNFEFDVNINLSRSRWATL